MTKTAALFCAYVSGVSKRKVKDALKAVAGEKIRLSKSTVSRITKRIREEFKTWQRRSLAVDLGQSESDRS